MRKLAENQRIRFDEYYVTERGWTHDKYAPMIILEQKGRIFWKQLCHEKLPENFGYDCTDEVKNMLINSLLLKHENNLLYQNMKDQQKIKMKKFKKCIKN